MPQRTLLLQMSGDKEVKITLPEGARVTFGPAIPFEKKNNNGYGSKADYSLRVYEGKGNDTLCAVFCGVESFRNLDMPHATLVVRESGKALWKSDENGYQVEEQVNKERSFVNTAKLLNE